VTTREQKFEKGLRTIRSALGTALNQKGVRDASISYSIPGFAPLVPDATFKVVANGQTEELMFTNEQIADSAARLDSSAITKVRMLVSRFG
jgi:hypothetical protein